MASDWLSIEMDWTTVLLLILLWYLLLRKWERDGKLDDWKASRVLGGILMVRTGSGKKVLEKISKPRKFWRAYGELSLWTCWFAMFIVAIMLVFVFIAAIIFPRPDPPSASELVAIPGLNPMIPLGWGALAFVVCLVIHEFGHGIQARAHGMRIRNFGLLLLGPLPLGAFAEPEHSELLESPRRDRQRMFAAGPATNLFAALLLMILMGSIAGQFVAADPGVHSRAIVVDSGAEQAGLEPWDVILSIDGEEVATTDDFSETMSELSANQTVVLQVKRYNDSTIENLNVTLTDKYQYYLDLGVDSEALDNLGIEPGDAFLGVNSLSDGTAGVDRLAGPYHSDFEGGVIDYAVNIPVHTMILLVTPFDLQGVAIHPAQEEMLGTGDGWLAQTLGLEGMLFLVNLIFWLIWVNILLGFTNLIPMVPFDGGHLFRDMVHGIMSGLRKLGKKTRLWKIHPLWIEHVSRKTSSFSSLILLLMLVFLIGSPYL